MFQFILKPQVVLVWGSRQYLWPYLGSLSKAHLRISRDRGPAVGQCKIRLQSPQGIAIGGAIKPTLSLLLTGPMTLPP